MESFAVVTGGNRGLGLEVCRKLVKLNKPTILTARGAAGAAIAESLGPLCRFYQLDVSDPSSIQAFVQALGKDLPGQQIDLLINNGAVLLSDWNQENFDAAINTNVAGPVSLTRALEPQLKDGALVINVSSLVGQRSHIKDQDYIKTIHDATSVNELYSSLKFKEDSLQNGELTSTYSISKAALSKATTLMSQEPALKERSISLVSVCPGWCRTTMGQVGATVHNWPPPPRSPEEGADSILWPLKHFKDQLNGAYLDEAGEQFKDCV